MKNIKKVLTKAIIKIVNSISKQNYIINNTNNECVKEYKKNNFTVEYSYSDIFISNKRYFIDLEFLQNTNTNEIASIGCVLKYKNKIIDSFHMIYDGDTEKLTKNLKDSISKGVYTTKSKENMYIKFKQFIDKHGSYPMICWGEDGYLLNKDALEFNIHFKYIHDISGVITNFIKYKGNKPNTIISLENMKKLYGIEGRVLHDALSDSIDLSNIFKCYLEKKEPIINSDLLMTYFVNNSYKIIKMEEELDYIINEQDYKPKYFKSMMGEIYGIFNTDDNNNVKIHVNTIEIEDKIIRKADIKTVIIKTKEHELYITILGKTFRFIITKNTRRNLKSIKAIYENKYSRKCDIDAITIREAIESKNKNIK